MAISSALISVADYCSVGCRFCFRADRGATQLTVAKLARLLSRLRELGVRDICYTGGEPSDHPEFLDFCKLTIQFGLTASVVTSARTIAQQSTIQSACRFLSHITVSADTQALECEFGSKRSITSTFEFLQSLRGPTLSLHVTLYKLSSGDVNQIEKAVQLSACSVEISPLLPFGEQGTNVIEDSWDQFKCDLEVLIQRLQLSHRLLNIYRGAEIACDHFNCSKRRLYISASGELRVCPYQLEGTVSLFAKRQEIRERLDGLFASELPLQPQCVIVCR